jgi:hypothetical protein
VRQRVGKMARGKEKDAGFSAVPDFEQDGGGSVDVRRVIPPQSGNVRGREKRT